MWKYRDVPVGSKPRMRENVKRALKMEKKGVNRDNVYRYKPKWENFTY